MILRRRIGQIVRAVWGASDAVTAKRRHPRSLFEVQALEPRRLLSATPVISGDPSVHEASVYTLNLDAEDNDGEGVAYWSINWGDGNTDQIGGNPFTAQHIYNLNATTETITASVTENGSGGGYGDSYGGGYGDGYGDGYGGTYSSNSLSVNVLGYAPTATIGSTTANPEANVVYNAVVYTGYSTSDSNNGKIQSVNVGWGDGSSTTYNASSYPGGVLPQPLPVTHTYSSGSGTSVFAVTAIATDEYSSGLPDTTYVKVADASLAPSEIDTTALYGSIEIDWQAGGSVPSGTTYSVYESTTDTKPSTPIASGLTGTSYTDTSSAASVANQTYYIWVEAHPITGAAAASEGPATTVPPQAATGYHWIKKAVPFGIAAGGFLDDPQDQPAHMNYDSKLFQAPLFGGYNSSNTYGEAGGYLIKTFGGIIVDDPVADASGSTIMNLQLDGYTQDQVSLSASGPGAVDSRSASDLPLNLPWLSPFSYDRWDLDGEFSGRASVFVGGAAGGFTQSILVHN